MPKQLGDNTTSNSRYFQRGVFVDKAKILSVEDLSNYPKKQSAEVKTIGNKNFQPQLCLKLKVNTGIEMDMYVFGKFNFKTDPISGKQLEYQGWRAKHNAVQNLLFKLLGTNAVIEDDDSISLATLNKLVGLEFYRLRYCQNREKMYEGRPSFQTFNIFEKSIEGNDDVLYKEFLKSAGSLKDYDSNLFDEWSEQQRGESGFDPSKFDEPAKEDVI